MSEKLTRVFEDGTAEEQILIGLLALDVVRAELKGLNGDVNLMVTEGTVRHSDGAECIEVILSGRAEAIARALQKVKGLRWDIEDAEGEF